MCLNCGPTYGCQPDCTNMLAMEEAGAKFYTVGGMKYAVQDVPADSVNHPAHYGGKDDLYEVIKVAEAWGFDEDAYLFNVLKYIRRDKTDQLEDLKKAKFYLERKISRLEDKKSSVEIRPATPYQFPLPIITMKQGVKD